MGLAGSFGDQQFRCSACGHATPLYSPHCPSCLGKTLSKVQPEKSAGPSKSSADAPPISEGGGRAAGLSFPLIAVVIGLFVVVYSFLFAPKPDTSRSPSDMQADTAPKPEPRQARVVRHVVKPHVASQPKARATGPSPRKAAPMRLWSATSEDDN
jgi:hypothetical protein